MASAVVLALSTASLWAQDVPKVEVFGGGSVVNINDNDFKLTPFGWQASVNGNMDKKLGIVGDFGGNYRDGVKTHSFLGGVQLTHRVEKVSAFAQAKAGGVKFSGGGESDTNFQLGFGGGVDWNVTPKVAVRLFQIDWLPTRASSGTSGHEWVKNVTRLGVGVVFKGEKK